ncbi:hypothetical protein WH47_09379 [Habropoda laboriosa]|uniref:Homologous recombination OB-fold protein OB-fold domain-containing protein n=1 Tax=Habropoda laboriosa TaxID=597456 RepID=A0A0L7RFC4_9HYME|nr:PREDICTED: uncharacterized protein LOC108578802 [Habropoda laboriosa]KOC69421.1 hypothetical protein WH47_09379 [Habropoda laboriosa]
MFESDDWDLDQDFLNDVDDKTIKYCSQIDNQGSEPKRRKVEKNNDPTSSLNNDTDTWEENTINTTTLKQNGNKESRKNLILGMFNKNVPDKNISQDVSSDPKRSYDNIQTKAHASNTQNCENNQLPRKNLVLGILKNKNKQDKIIENNPKNIELRKFEPRINNNGNINSKQRSTAINNKTSSEISKSNFKVQSSSSNDNSKQYLFGNSTKQLLSNVLKQPSTSNIEFKNGSSNNSKFKHPPVQSNKKLTLVRKFPGPAGLLPDDIDTIPCVSYLNSLEESEIVNEENDCNSLSEYCSQDTKNLFTEGAWQLLLDDLPNDFLKGHEIATIKQVATLNGFNNTKVDFLAGIIEHIDYSHDNPPIVLKDFTDSIQGIVHRDVPLKYPGLLESNVVVLLHDVGLLRTSRTFASHKYQILISPSSLLAIYTSKGTIEHTQYMESVFENIADGRTKKQEEENKECISAKVAHSSKSSFQFNVKSNNNSKGSINSKKNTENTNKKESDFNTNMNEKNESINESMDYDTDMSFSISPKPITDSQSEKKFNNSTSKNLKHIKQKSEKQINVQNDDKERAENLFKSLKRFSPNAKKLLSKNSKVFQTNAGHSEPMSICSKEIESEVLNDMISQKMDVQEFDKNMSPNKVKSIVETVPSIYYNKTENKQKNIRSTLLQFKNADVLTPPEIVPVKKSSKDSGSLHDILGNTENDSDDEILSQFDMDTICSNYNEKS